MNFLKDVRTWGLTNALSVHWYRWYYALRDFAHRWLIPHFTDRDGDPPDFCIWLYYRVVCGQKECPPLEVRALTLPRVRYRTWRTHEFVWGENPDIPTMGKRRLAVAIADEDRAFIWRVGLAANDIHALVLVFPAWTAPRLRVMTFPFLMVTEYEETVSPVSMISFLSKNAGKDWSFVVNGREPEFMKGANATEVEQIVARWTKFRGDPLLGIHDVLDGGRYAVCTEG